MRHPPYFIVPRLRPRIGELILASLSHQHIQVAALAVAGANFHVLIHCPHDNPKPILGHVKAHVVFHVAAVIDSRTKERERMWEGECGVKPIADLVHGKRAYRYILEHVAEGAWVWSHRASDLGPQKEARL